MPNEKWDVLLTREEKWNILFAYKRADDMMLNNKCADPVDGGCIPSWSCLYEGGRDIVSSIAKFLKVFGFETRKEILAEWGRVQSIQPR
jgi:hypothetical protein